LHWIVPALAQGTSEWKVSLAPYSVGVCGVSPLHLLDLVGPAACDLETIKAIKVGSVTPVV
jgi:hypothetical protein